MTIAERTKPRRSNVRALNSVNHLETKHMANNSAATPLHQATTQRLVDTPEAAFIYNPAVDPLSIDDVMSCGLLRSLAVTRLLLGDIGANGEFTHSAATVTNSLWMLEGPTGAVAQRDDELPSGGKSMNSLVIANTGIRQDAEGRYSLNDLHKSSGGEARHRPSRWVENQQTQELITEVESGAGIPALISQARGVNQGTWVCEELLFAYAAWVSAKFHVYVLQTFRAAVIQEKQAAGGEFAQGAFKEFQATRLELITTVADMTEQSLRVADLLGFQGNQSRFYADKLVKRQIGIGPMELLGVKALPGAAAELTYTPTQLGERFNMSGKAFNSLLSKHGFQEKAPAGETPPWRPTAKGTQHSEYEDTGREHNSGGPVRTLRWKESILDELRNVATQLVPILRPVARG